MVELQQRYGGHLRQPDIERLSQQWDHAWVVGCRLAHLVDEIGESDAACFIGALKVAGQQLKLKVPADVSVTAQVGIGPRSEGGFGITADLEVALPGLEREDAQKLVDAAHQICPYSNATRGNVDVGLSLA